MKIGTLGYVFVTSPPNLVKAPTERRSSLFCRESASISTNPQTGRSRCSRYYFAFLLLPASSLQGSHHGRCDREHPDIRKALGPMPVRGVLCGNVSSGESLTAAEICCGHPKAVPWPQWLRVKGQSPASVPEFIFLLLIAEFQRTAGWAVPPKVVLGVLSAECWWLSPDVPATMESDTSWLRQMTKNKWRSS